MMTAALSLSLALAAFTAWCFFFQKKHSLLRVYGPLAALRYIAESQRTKLTQYLERAGDGRPFALFKREWVYRASKGLPTSVGFGTQKDPHAPGTHAFIPAPFGITKAEMGDAAFAVQVGGFTVRYPMMRSAGSFGAFGAHWTRAASDGAGILGAGFLDNTGEGGLAPHHLSVSLENQEYLDRLNERAGALGADYTFRFDRTATSDGKVIEVPLSLRRGMIKDGRYVLKPFVEGVVEDIKELFGPTIDEGRGVSERPRNLIVQIGPSLSGFRTADGQIDWEWLNYVCSLPDVAGVEIKSQQGAKPNDGGTVKKEKLTAELRALRGFSGNADYVSPERLPFIRGGRNIEGQVEDLMGVIAQIRNLPNVKRRNLLVGYKMTYSGHEFIKALAPYLSNGGPKMDYLVVDGAEGGTGAADPIMTDRVGVHTYEGLTRTVDALKACGVRAQVKVVCSGRLADPGDVATVLALGADYCNGIRGYMLATGCIQAAECHNGKCPTGITTHHSWRLRGFDPTLKSVRFANYAHALRAGVVKIARSVNVRLDKGETFKREHLFVAK
jgi:glutamate synthase domain-containing protein 2